MGLIQQTDPAKATGKKEKKSGGVAFILSILFHVSILLLIGGIVLIPAVVQKSAFVSSGGDLVQTDMMMEAPPDAANVQNDLPNSQLPQETMTLPEQPNPVAPTDIVVARQDSSMASSSWASSVASAPSVSAKMPTFSSQDSQADRHDPSKDAEKKISTSATRITLFGSQEKDASSRYGLEGSLYDLKQGPDKKDNNMKVLVKDYSIAKEKEKPANDEAYQIMLDFAKGGYKTSTLKKYYKAKESLYLTFLMIPNINADLAPKEFNVEKEVDPRRWIIHYTGKISPKESGRYRFWGIGDDIMVLSINSKIVLNGSLGNIGNAPEERMQLFDPDKKKAPESLYNPKKEGINNYYPRMGQWIQLSAGQSYEMNLMIAELPGGGFQAQLLIEKEGVEYKKNPDGFPILPLFRLNSVKIPPAIQKEWSKVPYKFLLEGPEFDSM